MDTPTPSERQAIAEKAGLNAQYLYQCLTGRRDLEAAQAVALERISEGRIRRWSVRRDWHLIWPDLIGTEGAPAVPVAEAEVRDAA